MSSVLGVGVIGCGNISATYFRNVPMFKNIKVVACADINPMSSYDSSKEFGVTALSVEEILNDKDIDILVNLTIPSAHFSVSQSILEAGKHVYTEKPLAISLEEAHRLKTISEKKGLMIAAAPDTFLGGAHQHARYLVDSGDLGNIIGGSCNFMNHGMEHWHPNPEFFYQNGGGPIFDLAPYFLSNLVQILGPISEVTALHSMPEKERIILSEENYGKVIQVNTPTTIHSILKFKNGSLVTLGASWDVWKHGLPDMELYGSRGSLKIPDPNFFGGQVQKCDPEGNFENIVKWDHPFGVENEENESDSFANYRSVGLSDLAFSIEKGDTPRCSIDLAIHCIEVMIAILKSGEKGSSIKISTSVKRPRSLLTEEAKNMME